MRIQDVVDELQRVIPDKRVSIKLSSPDGKYLETEVFEVIKGENDNLILVGTGELKDPVISNAESEVY